MQSLTEKILLLISICLAHYLNKNKLLSKEYYFSVYNWVLRVHFFLSSLDRLISPWKRLKSKAAKNIKNSFSWKLTSVIQQCFIIITEVINKRFNDENQGKIGDGGSSRNNRKLLWLYIFPKSEGERGGKEIRKWIMHTRTLGSNIYAFINVWLKE